MDRAMDSIGGDIEFNGFVFYNQFDSANLAKVVPVYTPSSTESVVRPESTTNTYCGKGHLHPFVEKIEAEFNLWTKPDCYGTEFENGNRTWFYFGIKSPYPGIVIKLNMVDLNRQGKMYSQGMAPVFRTLPGKGHWERIRDKPQFYTEDDIFTVSFKFKSPENIDAITYFAFTYPFSYDDIQRSLQNLDAKFKSAAAAKPHSDLDDIYYRRETLCYSLGKREVSLITITSHHGITEERELRLRNLFPNKGQQRAHRFAGKKTVFISARVHPGETPSSFVFHGFLNLLLARDDPVAVTLRRLYVFKMVPLLNPDGVALGHYRTDTRGVNLNRLYLSPVLAKHPAVYAARALLRYYHYGDEMDDIDFGTVTTSSKLRRDGHTQTTDGISGQVSQMRINDVFDTSREELGGLCEACRHHSDIVGDRRNLNIKGVCNGCATLMVNTTDYGHGNNNGMEQQENEEEEGGLKKREESGLFLYIDLHGHASKKGIFMYGNHFDDLEQTVECMLLPKLMSINNHNFHFTACNFTERNMYLKDKRDGMSREGSGRVAVLKLTGLIRSYTLECNYNTGRLVNILPATVKEPNGKIHCLPAPPKYSPQVFEEVGRSLGASILDLTGQNPLTRLPNSEFHSLTGLRDWLALNCIQNGSGGGHHHHHYDDIVRKSPIKLRLSSLQTQEKSPVLYRTNWKTRHHQILKKSPTNAHCHHHHHHYHHHILLHHPHHHHHPHYPSQQQQSRPNVNDNVIMSNQQDSKLSVVNNSNSIHSINEHAPRAIKATTSSGGGGGGTATTKIRPKSYPIIKFNKPTTSGPSNINTNNITTTNGRQSTTKNRLLKSATPTGMRQKRFSGGGGGKLGTAVVPSIGPPPTANVNAPIYAGGGDRIKLREICVMKLDHSGTKKSTTTTPTAANNNNSSNISTMKLLKAAKNKLIMSRTVNSKLVGGWDRKTVDDNDDNVKDNPSGSNHQNHYCNDNNNSGCGTTTTTATTTGTAILKCEGTIITSNNSKNSSSVLKPTSRTFIRKTTTTIFAKSPTSLKLKKRNLRRLTHSGTIHHDTNNGKLLLEKKNKRIRKFKI